MRTLVERYQHRVLAVVIGVIRSREDALEIVQETFIRAFRNLHGFRGNSSFYTWIYRIAINLSIDLQRRESKRSTIEFDETLPPAGGGEILDAARRGDDTYARVKNRELVAKIFQAMESLTPEHRAVILLREVDGLSYEEISESLDCSLGTVMSRLHYARKQLQAKLKEML